jgi:hypothetical protein
MASASNPTQAQPEATKSCILKIATREVGSSEPSADLLASSGARNHGSDATMTAHDRIELNPKVMLGKPRTRNSC